jgi:hypothetical protein
MRRGGAQVLFARRAAPSNIHAPHARGCASPPPSHPTPAMAEEYDAIDILCVAALAALLLQH